MITALAVFIPSLYILSFIYCVEETAHRKKSLERERACIEAGGPALSPPITGSSQSRTDEKRPEPRYHNNNNNKNKRISTNETHVYPSPARGRYQQSNIVRLNSEHSKSLAGWEPPLVWASTVEQDQSTLPRPSESQSRSYEEEMGISVSSDFCDSKTLQEGKLKNDFFISCYRIRVTILRMRAIYQVAKYYSLQSLINPSQMITSFLFLVTMIQFHLINQEDHQWYTYK